MVTKYKMMKNKRKSKSKTKLLKLLRKKKTIKKMRGGSLPPGASYFMKKYGSQMGTDISGFNPKTMSMTPGFNPTKGQGFDPNKLAENPDVAQLVKKFQELQEQQKLQQGYTPNSGLVKLGTSIAGTQWGQNFARKAMMSPLATQFANKYGLGDELKQAQSLATPDNFKKLGSAVASGDPSKLSSLATPSNLQKISSIESGISSKMQQGFSPPSKIATGASGMPSSKLGSMSGTPSSKMSGMSGTPSSKMSGMSSGMSGKMSGMSSGMSSFKFKR
jgi:hypothetical protein